MIKYGTLKEDTEFVYDGDPCLTIPAGTIVEVRINETFGDFGLFCGSVSTEWSIPIKKLPHYVDFLE